MGYTLYPGAKNLNPSSAIIYKGGDPVINDPSSAMQARNYMLGLTKSGDEVDPCAFPCGTVAGGVDCNTLNNKFWFSGNPVTNIGWINSLEGDLRQMLNTGPFILEAGKPVEIFLAYLVHQGADALNSITKVKDISHFALDLFNSNFDSSYVVSVNEEDMQKLPRGFELEQNYPNPFNPTTKIRYSIPTPPSSSPLVKGRNEVGFVTLKVYDMLGNEVATLFMNTNQPEVMKLNSEAEKLVTGVYFYQLKAGEFVQSKKMILLK